MHVIEPAGPLHTWLQHSPADAHAEVIPWQVGVPPPEEPTHAPLSQRPAQQWRSSVQNSLSWEHCGSYAGFSWQYAAFPVSMQYEVQHCASVVHAWPFPVHAFVAAGLLPQLASIAISTNPAVMIARPSIPRTIPH